MASHRYNYYNALTQMADFSFQAAKYLDDVINSFDHATLQDRIDEMHLIENAADDKRHEIMQTLAKEFLPPIDLGDIVELASRLDDIVDCIEEILQQLYIYNVETLLSECKVFSKLIYNCCESVLSIAKEFSHFRKSATIQECIITTNSLESEGDKLYLDIMRSLFTSDMNVKDLFIWAHIIPYFEDCCDDCEHVAEVFQSVIMKNT